MYLVGAHLVLQNVCYISASLCHSTFLAAVWCPFLWVQIILPLSWGLLRLEISIFQRYVTAHFSNFKIWTFPPFSWLGKYVYKKKVLKTETCRHRKDHLHHTCHVPTENFVVFFSGSNLCFGIQRQGPQDVEDSAKDGCSAWDVQSKKRMTYIREGCPLFGKDEYFWQLDLLHA